MTTICPYCKKNSVEIYHGNLNDDDDDCDCCCCRDSNATDIQKCDSCNIIFHQCEKNLEKVYDYHHFECGYCIEKNRLINNEKEKVIKIILQELYDYASNNIISACANRSNPKSFFGFINKITYHRKGFSKSFLTCKYCFDKYGVNESNYKKFLIIDIDTMGINSTMASDEKNIKVTNKEIFDYINGALYNPSKVYDGPPTPRNDLLIINDAVVINKRECENYVGA